jgi:hypothetical protein
LIDDVTTIHSLVQSFDRILAVQPPFRDVEQSFRPVARRVRQVEARVTRLDLTADLRRQWRDVRERTNAISDALGLPRVIVLVPAPRPAAGPNRNLLAQVDRAVAEVDELSVDLAKAQDDSRRRSIAGQLRLKLLEFRQRAIAQLTTEQLSQSLREIETLNQQLSESTGPIVRGGQGANVVRSPNPEKTIRKLRGLLFAR